MYVSQMIKKALLTLVLLLLSVTTTWASQSDYESKCLACHGENGEGNAVLKSPSIAGLSESYLMRQLTHFRDSVRGTHKKDSSGQLMASTSSSLTNSQIQSISQYLSNKPFQPAKPSEQSAGFIGAGLFRSCQSCHGAKGQGEESLFAPRIAGQHIWYLKKQLSDFRAGIRGSHKSDKLGKQMVDITQALNDDEQVDLILIHISKLKPTEQDHEVAH